MRVISSAASIVSEQLLGPRCLDWLADSKQTCINAPWFEGPKSTSQSVLRLSNSANVATGAVNLTLKNIVEGTQATSMTCGSDKLPALSGILPQGELVIDAAAAATCFGIFRRGDLTVTVSGQTYGLYPLMRLVSANGAMVSDQSLGRSVPGLSQGQ